MKRTVYNTMIGLMLACGLAMTSTGAMAQGRRPATNSGAAATGNRSVATASPRNNAATVTNNNSSFNRSAVSTTPSARPSVSNSSQVNRSASTSNNAAQRSTTSSITARPSVSSSSSKSTDTNVRRSGNSNTVRPSGTSGSSSNVRPSAGNRSASGSSVSSTAIPAANNVRHSGNNSGNDNRSGNSVRPGNNSGKTGHVTAPTTRPRNDNRPKVAGTVMTGGGPKIDYNAYRYSSSWRPRYNGDPFYNSFRYNSWSWASPIRPSVRPWRPSTIWVYRPIVTVNVSRYSSYPTIGGVLGLAWGTHYGNALNYLYYNGYYIDGYMNNIVYLTDVSILNYDWDDVMLQFDGNDRLDYVEFSSWSVSYDTSRFYSLYNYLCSIYGSPVSYHDAMYSWYGGDGIGFVNLGIKYNPDYNYTVLAFGV